MNLTQEHGVCEVPAASNNSLLGIGHNVDIVGVTGSIPVTPTIRTPSLSTFLRFAAKFPLGPSNLCGANWSNQQWQ